jgi:predicted RNA binding protein YcfA (HicA-like mRNA interferase family)
MRMRGYAPRELVNIIKKKGWSLSRVKGSHHIYQHPNKDKNITIPMKGKEVSRPLSKRILKEVEAL